MSLLDHLSHLNESSKHNFDIGAISIMAATFFSWLPNLSALLSVIWFALRIYETRTIQKWLGKSPPQERENDVKKGRQE